jgi:hypothetical protein
VVGGERSGEDMSETRGLTSGPELPAGERRERERGGAADGWGPAVRHGRGRAKLGRLGHGRERGGSGRERGGKWLGPENSPAEGESFSFFYFYFLFSISHSYFLFLFLFISFSFEQQFAK